MADLEQEGPIFSFRTQGEPPGVAPADAVLYAWRSSSLAGWSVTSDSSAAGGKRLANPNAGTPKLSGALAAPTQYFDLQFTAAAGVPYRIWIRGKAAGNSWANDSVYVQFSDSVTSGGAPTYRIGTTSATAVTIENCTNCGLSNWGWNDNAIGEGTLGPVVYFETGATHTLRVQVREDGLSIDQIILSSGTFLDSAPGAPRDDGTIYPEQGGTGGEPPPPPPSPPPGDLPVPWSSQDVGSVGMVGNASHGDGTFTVEASGSDVWGSSDQFRFVYQPLTGDGTIVARVAALEAVASWTKAGVMMRESLDADAPHAFMLVSPGKGLAFQRRVAAGGSSTHTSGGAGTAPAWVRLTRSGDIFTAYRSADGTGWTLVGAQTIAMPPTIQIGLALNGHDNTTLATAAFDSVSVSETGDPPLPPLPEPWSSADVGPVGIPGSEHHEDGTFTINASGSDVWGTSDQFRYVYQPLTGDGSIVARVASVEHVAAWTKAGVMMRASLDPASAHAFMLVSPGKGLAFQRRVASGGLSTHTSGGDGVAPAWVKLTRTGDTFSAYRSADGVTWTLVGRDTVPMGGNIQIGLALNGHSNSTLATAVFDSVSVVAGP
jgi:hypothetical protein